jgi:uncharacterized Zn finger protein (UPF0148 family)
MAKTKGKGFYEIFFAQNYYKMLSEIDQELGIARIGEFLLKGMVLTDLNCPACKIPTMRSKDKKVVGWCVLCDYVDQNVPVVKAKSVVVSHVPAVNVSKELGVKLMQGWTMLQECCNTCVGVPLMRSQDEECYCVSCQKWKTLDLNGVHDIPEKVVETNPKELLNSTQTMPAQLIEDEALEEQLEQIYENAPSNVKTSVSPPSSATTAVIKEKIQLLSVMLGKATYPREIQEICDAMKSASDALKSLE